MTLKLSKTALRELRALYRAVLMGVIMCGFISGTAHATVSVEDGAGGTTTVYTSDEIDNLLSAKQDTLTDDSITANKIADDAVGQNHIANSAVGTNELIDGSITSQKLDVDLQASINQVATNTDNITTNTNAIATLTGDANTTGSVANIVNSAVNDLANGQVATNTDAIAVLNGNASTEGSVAKTVADAVATKQDTLSDTQMNAVNSGITADKVATYDAYADKINDNENAIVALQTGKADATTVATNTANIANNTNAIAQNAEKIAENAEKISDNTADIAALQTGKANVADVYTKTEVNTQIADTKAYADTQDATTLAAAKTYAEEKATTAETNAKTYTDSLATGAVATNTANITANTNAIAILNGDVNTTGSVAQQVETALTSANSYTDTQIADTKAYTDTQIADTKAYADTQDAATLAAAKTYAEEKATAAETNAKSYTDTLIGSTDVLVEQNGIMQIGTVNSNIAALNNTIGDITDLNQYAEGSVLGNALTQGGTQSADTVVAALNNIDATLGTIHGLRDKLATSGAGTNLASGTTVEQHLTALDSAIGNRAYTSTHYVSSGSDLSSAVSTLDSNLSRVEGNLDALTNRTHKMHHEMKSGFASLAAMSALVPNARVAGDTQISVGTGHYRGTTGFALGAFHHVNDNVLLNAGAAYGGNGSATFKGGLTFGW